MNQTFNYYLITDPQYYTNDKNTFKEKLEDILTNKRVDMACFRDKESANYEELANIFINTCKKFNIKQIILNRNLELAINLNCGIHLTSQQFDKIKIAKEKNIYTIISCHNEKDIEKAIKEKADAITYSPIFYTPNKGQEKGIKALEDMQKKYQIKIIALGGIIADLQIKQIQDCQVFGFASIRYFI
ncbi:thiamine monophosphate synthase [Arcobacter nitrofigilis DSM 7299]|uniref:Thiamine monophosphate synthase n=1 Tax=Arcobacter nitrofigilis (strain ATCC 33309 / DSM 7299 / CCUG 15893 / LMG 7604 / NCTC 12251 / CI) TaxID=572480 RepID=D5UZE1_ARCNC|nr:thiamine phosphate synthase [Arcobacter nitrofigilis]ADG92178.1 thiamine monophosphate synthase [Arcobacter nitrofigilis DSM 7299]